MRCLFVPLLVTPSIPSNSGVALDGAGGGGGGGGGGGAVLVFGFLLVGLLGPFDPNAPCVLGDFATSYIVSVVVFLG